MHSLVRTEKKKNNIPFQFIKTLYEFYVRIVKHAQFLHAEDHFILIFGEYTGTPPIGTT